MTQLAVQTDGLTKHFGKQKVVDHIDLNVPQGSVFGFLGPNGCGKTTTIRMLLGLIRPDNGTSHLLGEPMPAGSAEVLPKVGVLVEGPAFHPYLSGRANLARLDDADLRADATTSKQRIAQALDRVGLTAAAGKRYRAYSLGMRQRLAIAAALLQPRELLILDEPTNGLDPQGTREVRNLVSSLSHDGTTVLVSSHLLSEVEQICDHVAVMNRGALKAQGNLDELRSSMTTHAVLQTPDTEAALGTLASLDITGTPQPHHRIELEPGSTPTEIIIAALVRSDVRVQAFNVITPSLEDLFVGLTGTGFDVSG